MTIVEPPSDGKTRSMDNPILTSPYAQPTRHYEVGPTGVIKDGRRPSESWIPIAVSRKGKKGEPVQETIDFDVTGERRERNELINEIRRDVAKWRSDGQYGGVTPITRKLLQYWADEDRENRVIFAQRDAAETAILLTEVAGRHHGYADWRRRLEPENEAHNDGLPRVCGGGFRVEIKADTRPGAPYALVSRPTLKASALGSAGRVATRQGWHALRSTV
jgi:type III restriction enzyme